ncbi:hypothetical protein [Azospirillum sp.]|uniref:hypothetical protein n=1 Tax=Azospirillum sp. TaxID=34012 RepID=UPI003D75F98C
MLYRDSAIPPDVAPAEYHDMVQAVWKWNPAVEEVSAASDYALDSMARSTGGPRHQRREGQGGDWSADRSLRWWMIDHREGVA